MRRQNYKESTSKHEQGEKESNIISGGTRAVSRVQSIIPVTVEFFQLYGSSI